MGQAGDSPAGPLTDCCCALRIVLGQLRQPPLQARGIELIDGKHSDTALRATLSADQPALASASRISECAIDDLNQLLIAGNGRAKSHGERILLFLEGWFSYGTDLYDGFFALD